MGYNDFLESFVDRMDDLANSSFNEFVVGYQVWSIFGNAVKLIFAVITVIGMWKIFSKAGEEGWASLIPFYNRYVLFKVSGMKNWFWFYLAADVIVFAAAVASVFILIGMLVGLFMDGGSDAAALGGILLGVIIVASIASLFVFVTKVVNCVKLASSFDLGVGWMIGLFFLAPIFYMIIGFSENIRYKGRAEAAGGQGVDGNPYYSQTSYQSQNTYRSQSPYQSQNTYQVQSPYQSQNTYQAQSPYQSQNTYQAQSPYQSQNTYQAQSPYQSQSPYQAQSPYQQAPAQGQNASGTQAGGDSQ